MLAGITTHVVLLPEETDVPVPPPNPDPVPVVGIDELELELGGRLDVVEIGIDVPDEQTVPPTDPEFAQEHTALAAVKTASSSEASHELATQGVTSVVRRA